MTITALEAIASSNGKNAVQSRADSHFSGILKKKILIWVLVERMLYCEVLKLTAPILFHGNTEQSHVDLGVQFRIIWIDRVCGPPSIPPLPHFPPFPVAPPPPCTRAALHQC